MSDESKKEDDQQPDVPSEESAEEFHDPQLAVLDEYGIADIAELDKLELSVLIVVKNKPPFESAATFLTRRNWPTTVVSSLPEAIQALVAHQPNFVLISANHPNPKIAKLPLIVAQAFNTKCIGFAEKNDGHSVGQLNAMRVSHRFFGQLSGPSIHRQIKKIIKDEYDAAKPQRQSDPTLAGHSEEGTIHVAGGSHDSHQQNLGEGRRAKRGPAVIRGEKPNAASLMKMLAESGDDSDEGEESDSDSLIYQESQGGTLSGRKAQIHFQKGTRGPGSQDPRGAKADEHREQESSGSQSPYGTSPGTGSSEASGRTTTQPGSKAGRSFEVSQPKAIKPVKEEEAEQEGKTPRAGDFLDKSEDGQGIGGQAEEQGPGAGKLHQATEGETGLGAEHSAQQDGLQGESHRADQNVEGSGSELNSRQNGQLTAESHQARQNSAAGSGGHANQKSSETSGDVHGPGRGTTGDQDYQGASSKDGKDHMVGADTDGSASLEAQIKELDATVAPQTEDMIGLAKAVKKALDEVCRENNQHTKYLVRAPVLGIIPYRSSKQHGFVTVAWADHHHKGTQGFLEALRYSLMNFLPMEGVQASLDQEFVMEVGDIHFLKLAEGDSQFLIVREHEGIEVGVAFFEGEKNKTRVKKAVDKMVNIKVDDLSTEDPVTFKAYLKMELNQKYVLYLTEGRKILSSQKDRLKKSKVPGLHINEEDFEKFIRYLAEVEVRNLVRKFNKQQSEPQSA